MSSLWQSPHSPGIVLAHGGRGRVLHAVLVHVAVDADGAIAAFLPGHAVRALVLPVLEHVLVAGAAGFR